MTVPAPAIQSLAGRRIVVTGDAATPRAVAHALEAAGASVALLNEWSSEAALGQALTDLEKQFGALDQVVHAWAPPSILEKREFASISEDEWAAGCESALAGAWWLARAAIPALERSRGTLTFLIPTVGMSGAAGFSMLASVAEGIRLLAKGSGRQLGTQGVTVNSIATAAHLWLPEPDAVAVTGTTTLSTPAFGRPGDAADDIAPIVALLAQPEAHFVTAGTVVADGGIWMGL